MRVVVLIGLGLLITAIVLKSSEPQAFFLTSDIISILNVSVGSACLLALLVTWAAFVRRLARCGQGRAGQGAAGRAGAGHGRSGAAGGAAGAAVQAGVPQAASAALDRPPSPPTPPSPPQPPIYPVGPVHQLAEQGQESWSS